MKTKITENIDGYEIIAGIGEAQIDPVATDPIVNEEFKKEEIYIQVEKLKSDYTNILSAGKKAFENARSATSVSDKNLYTSEYQKRGEELKEIESQLLVLFPTLQDKKKELILKHAVYFNPGVGKVLISDEEGEVLENALINSSKNNNFLSVDLKEICDLRGKSAYVKNDKWSKREIIKIGDNLKTGEKLILTESEQVEFYEQLESERIAKLTVSEKLAEKTGVISALAKQANEMKGVLEIQGDSKALDKSKAWYSAEVAKVETKYL